MKNELITELPRESRRNHIGWKLQADSCNIIFVFDYQQISNKVLETMKCISVRLNANYVSSMRHQVHR